MGKNKLKLNEFHQKKKFKNRGTSLKKKVRDMQRLMNKLKENNTEIDPSKEQELQIMEQELKKKEKKEQILDKIDRKYQKFKFFELKKLSKMEKRVLDALLEKKDNPELKQQLEDIQNQFAYIKFYPHGQKYISVLKEPENPQTKKMKLKYMKQAIEQRQLKLNQSNQRKENFETLENEIRHFHEKKQLSKKEKLREQRKQKKSEKGNKKEDEEDEEEEEEEENEEIEEVQDNDEVEEDDFFIAQLIITNQNAFLLQGNLQCQKCYF